MRPRYRHHPDHRLVGMRLLDVGRPRDDDGALLRTARARYDRVQLHPVAHGQHEVRDLGNRPERHARPAPPALR